MDAADMANYRPVFNLSFLSKTVERVVADQLNRYLASSGLIRPLQSAYRACHSTETALLRVMSDVFAAADQQRITMLGMLDLSAAFDCVDHSILLLHLERGTIWSDAHLAAVVSDRPDSVHRYTLQSYRWLSSYSGEFRRAPCWARSYSCSIPLRSSAL